MQQPWGENYTARKRSSADQQGVSPGAFAERNTHAAIAIGDTDGDRRCTSPAGSRRNFPAEAARSCVCFQGVHKGDVNGKAISC